MKKGLILGAAAIAAIAVAPTADAVEVKTSGYYKFRVYDNNPNFTSAAGGDNNRTWGNRMQINTDFTTGASSLHLRYRPVDTAQLANMTGTDPRNAAAAWAIKQLWLETSMWGVAVKVGDMPVKLNDSWLVSDGGNSFPTILLAKGFGDITVVGAEVKVQEGAANNSDDDIDLWVLSVVGASGAYNWQVTGAYADIGDGFNAGLPNGDENFWLAGTLSTQFEGMKLAGTVIWESGWENLGAVVGAAAGDPDDGDFLLALNIGGDASWGGWKGYFVYAGEEFDAINKVSADEPIITAAWDEGGPGQAMLLTRALAGINYHSSVSGNAQFSNMWALGVNASLKAGGWTITPAVDFVAAADDKKSRTIDSAFGGSLKVSTSVADDTTFSLIGVVVDASQKNALPAGTDEELAHSLIAELNYKF
ncbi:MAG: hypothetical protein H7831_02075 [Magnetococcus sp. WYHC-3]